LKPSKKIWDVHPRKNQRFTYQVPFAIQLRKKQKEMEETLFFCNFSPFHPPKIRDGNLVSSRPQLRLFRSFGEVAKLQKAL